MVKQNAQMSRIKLFSIRMVQLWQEVYIKCDKLIEEVMEAIGF